MTFETAAEKGWLWVDYRTGRGKGYNYHVREKLNRPRRSLSRAAKTVIKWMGRISSDPRQSAKR
jgi:hypothetical protein